MAIKGVTPFGGTVEGWNGGTEWRNTRNILKYGTHGIFYNTENIEYFETRKYTEYSKTQNIWISLKRGMGGKYLKKGYKKIHFLSVSSMGTTTKLRIIIVHFLAPKDIKMCYREELTPERYV